MNDLQWYLDLIKKILRDNGKFTGHVELNFFKGNVSNMNRLDSIKKPFDNKDKQV